MEEQRDREENMEERAWEKAPKISIKIKLWQLQRNQLSPGKAVQTHPYIQRKPHPSSVQLTVQLKKKQSQHLLHTVLSARKVGQLLIKGSVAF